MQDDHLIGSGFSERELQVSSWWNQHHLLLRRIGYVSLMFLAVLEWGYVIWTIVDYSYLAKSRERAIHRALVTTPFNADVLAQGSPKPIQSQGVFVFQRSEGRKDFYTEIINPNAQWGARFTYSFESEGVSTPKRDGFILPSGRQPLTEIGWQASGTQALTGQLQIHDLVWERVNPKTTKGNLEQFVLERLNLQFDQVEYRTDQIVGQTPVGQTTMIVRNKSGYGYWQVPLTILLSRMDGPVAVTSYILKELRPGESRQLVINWFDLQQNIVKTEVRADINIFDQSIFLSSDRL